MLSLWTTFAVALVVSVALTPLTRAFARRFGWIARPRNDRWHRGQVALMGGVAIYAACVAAVAWGGMLRGRTALLLGLAGFTLAVGLWDDRRPLRPSTKLLAQILVALTFVFTSPIVALTPSPTLNTILSIFWLVGVTNAMNLLDNMDGLAAGVGLIAAGFYVLLADGLAPPGYLATLAALGGALAGFLVYNFSPASIFMGDGGSLFVGFVLAGVTMPLADPKVASVVPALSVPAVLLAIPILDTTVVSVVRRLSGRHISEGGRDHTSHRLVAIGLSERAAVLFLYALAATAGSVAYLIYHSRSSVGMLLLVAFSVALLLFGVHIARVRTYPEGQFQSLEGKAFTSLLAQLTWRRHVFEVLLDLVLVWLSYSLAFHLRFEGAEAEYFYPFFLRSLPLVILCKLAGLWVADIYGGVWRYLSITDLVTYVKGVVLGSGAAVLVVVYLYRFTGFSRGVFIIDGLVLFLLLVGSRLSLRLLLESGGRRRAAGTPVLVYGAGGGAATLLREISANAELNLRAVGLIDDEASKLGQRVLGCSVLGGVDKIEEILQRSGAEQVIISTGTINGERLASLLTTCTARGISVRRMRFVIE